jgi:hypothetical protein
MSVEVVLGEPEEEQEAEQPDGKVDPDEFFAKNAFRIVYQTNNFFLPQVRDLIDKGEILSTRPDSIGTVTAGTYIQLETSLPIT